MHRATRIAIAAGIVVAAVAGVVVGRRALNTAAEAPDELIATALTNRAFAWDSLVAPAFTLYAQRGSGANRRLGELRTDVERSIAHALEMLGEPAYPAHLKVFYVRSRDDVVAVTGMKGMGITRAAYNAIVLAAPDTIRLAHRHEVMHAVSLRLWGHPGAPAGEPREPRDYDVWARGGWLREGLATAADKACVPWTVRGLAAQMLAEGDRIPLDTLTAAFYEKDDLSAYLQGGSLVEFLLGKYGRDRFRSLWRQGAGSIGAMYGKPSEAIEAEWIEWLKAAPAGERPASMAAVRGPGCK